MSDIRPDPDLEPGDDAGEPTIEWPAPSDDPDVEPTGHPAEPLEPDAEPGAEPD